MSAPRRQRGLTLVELLVALGIFALVSAASTTVLSLAIAGRDQLEASTDEVRRVERARSLLRADLGQLSARPVRDAEGRAEPAFAGGEGIRVPLGAREGQREGEDTLIVLTRTGWDNPGDLRPRATLQRVTWLVRDGALIRRTRPYLDAAAGTPSTDQVVLGDLTSVEVGFYDGQAWRSGFASEEGGAPLAVRLSFDHPGLGPLRNDFLTGPR